MEDLQKIREWIRFACERNGVPELTQVILIEWNKRFTNRLGDAIYNRISMRARIRLSLPLWPRLTTEEERQGDGGSRSLPCDRRLQTRVRSSPSRLRVEGSDAELRFETSSAPLCG